jgi:hypothetical protein
MKSIKEKELLAKFAKSLGQEIDPALIKEVESFNSIKKDAHASIKKNALNDLMEAFKTANLEKEIIEIIEYPLPPTLDEVLSILNEPETEILNELVQKNTIEESSIVEEIPIPTPTIEKTLAERAAQFISEAPKDSFQQPDPDPVSKNFEDIQRKLKFLEATIGKIAVAGPGSGETKFRMLDDVDRSSIGNTDQVLRWNPDPRGDAYGKFFFGQVSGDQGPIRSMRYDTNGYGANANVVPGLTAWNTVQDCLDIYHKDGSVLQVGLEQYIRVYNNTSNVLYNGTFVQFAGVIDTGANVQFEACNFVVTCEPYISNTTADQLYTVGVLTTDVLPNTIGRATTFGEVRNLNTTGNLVNEVWYSGDLLWGHPGIPGALTKVRPTSPNAVISVAAVIHADVGDGILLVRPTIEYRRPYGVFSSNVSQRANVINTPYAITYNIVNFSNGIFANGANILMNGNYGLYDIQYNLQLVSTNAAAKDVWVWARKNGLDIPLSARRVSITGNGVETVLAGNFFVSMVFNDRFEIYWAADSTSVRLDAPPVTTFAPAIPSVRVSVAQIAR